MKNSLKKQLSFKQKLQLLIFGLFVCIIILEIGLRLGGLVFIFLQERNNINSIKQKGEFRVMCLGESTTVLWGRDAYPYQLEGILNQLNTGIKFSVINNGLSGTTTSKISARLEADLNKYKPDIVTAMIGINDREEPTAYSTVTFLDTPKIFFKNFRTYKLINLIYMHLVARINKVYFKWRIKNEKNFDSDWIFSTFNLKKFHADQKIPLQAEQVLKDAILQDPKNDKLYLGLGLFYQNYELFSQAEKALKKAIEIDPQNSEAYLVLGVVYEESGRQYAAEKSLKKAIELNPTGEEAYAELGWYYQQRNMLHQAEEAFKKTIELNPNNEAGYEGLGMTYEEKGRYSEAEKMFKKAISVDHKSGNSYEGLVRIYERQKNYASAEEMFKKCIELNPNSDWPYQYAIRFYNELGEEILAQKYLRRMQRLRLDYHNPITQYNYKKIRKILDKRGIKLVCIQYPMRSIEPLKKIFEGDEGVMFVDNEKIFKNALLNANYKEYFTDLFAGDFGHCTRKGNRLLAENIANVILKDISTTK
ncbi:MAG: tetratricopeptide repeat protein [Candidatus Firestonebacteria bacterium]